MALSSGGSAPFLISGGGIGGLIAAYSLARQGFPVRLFPFWLSVLLFG